MQAAAAADDVCACFRCSMVAVVGAIFTRRTVIVEVATLVPGRLLAETATEEKTVRIVTLSLQHNMHGLMKD